MLLRSQRIRYDDSGQTARRAGALNCARSAGVVHLCNHEVCADAEYDLFVKVKDLITDLIRSQADAPPGTNQKSHCDEETSKATEKKEDRDLFSVAYKNAVDNRRAAWRVITSVGQKKKSKSEEQLASYAREYIAKVENELQKIREGVLALMDKKLVPSPSNDESKAFYYKMKSDYHRYLAEQDTEVPKTSSRDRTLQHAAEQIPKVPVPEMVTQSAEVPETVSRDGVQQRTVEQIVDAPVPQVVEELAGVSRVFSQDRIQQRAVEQAIENPAVSLVEKIVEIPVTWKTQQGVNTHVQHVVNTVEVERPKLVKETVQEKINQVTKHIKIPQVHFLNKVDDMLVDVQRQILPMAQTVQKTMEIPQLQCVDKVVDNPEAPQVQVSEKTVEISQLQAVEKIFETLETQTIQGVQTSES